MESLSDNPISHIVEQQGVVVLDGGLATALEARGRDLDDNLWSAKTLIEDPDAIRQVHTDFLFAGADCITTSSYQATLPGFRARGLSEDEGADMLRRSTALAVEARDAFWSSPSNRQGRVKPLVAASIGPYGAFLADGSEYVGRYDIDDDELLAFHRDRWHVLAETDADLLACETIPSSREAGVLLHLLEKTPGRWAWMSFSCCNETSLNDGTRLTDVARDCDAQPRVAAVGINCTSPRFIPSLIGEVCKSTAKPILVYPNSGERYERGDWIGGPQTVEWEKAAAEWVRLGAVGVGGCCRVGPQEIAEIRRMILPAT